jgi:hypothetical protein
MLKVEVVVVVADDVPLPHGETFATPKVPHPEPHPERRAATKAGKAVRIAFMCLEKGGLLQSEWVNCDIFRYSALNV